MIWERQGRARINACQVAALNQRIDEKAAHKDVANKFWEVDQATKAGIKKYESLEATVRQEIGNIEGTLPTMMGNIVHLGAQPCKPYECCDYVLFEVACAELS